MGDEHLPADQPAHSVLVAELWMDGRLQTDRIDPIVWAQTMTRGVFTVLAGGLVAHEPRCVVRVRDRRTSEWVIEHDWGTRAEAAARDYDAIRGALQSMSVEEFANEHGVELDP
jgi:hypothetical protein